MERTVTFKGQTVTLEGEELKIAQEAPDFIAVTQDMKEIRLADYQGKIKVITSFPSLDTPVCDLQVKEFNKRAARLSDDVVVLGISMDLPFAQARFCQENEIKNAVVVSDYRYASFGWNYGLLIKELRLLARSVIILDKNNVVRYIQIVSNTGTPPDYDSALTKLAEIKQGQLQPKEV
ncbi:MAG TPA: thiol peroxidase [Planctomycetota bacterium]|nr:thiol peroxidase [Planctomycetota bacterium]